MDHPPLTVDADVVYVGADKKQHKGKITEVLGEHAARIDFSTKDQSNEAVAVYSENGLQGTFHFSSSAASAKEGTKAA